MVVILGGRLVFEANPEALLVKLAGVHTVSHFRRPSCFSGEFIAAR